MPFRSDHEAAGPAVRGVMLPYFAATRIGGYRFVRTRIFRKPAGLDRTRQGSLGRSLRGLDLVVRPGDESILMVGCSQLWQWPVLKLAKVVRRR
jgi:hypothetical protein